MSATETSPIANDADGAHSLHRLVIVLECWTCKDCGGEPKPLRDETGRWVITCRSCGIRSTSFENVFIAADSWNGHHVNEKADRPNSKVSGPPQHE